MFLKDILQDKAQFSQTECLIANYILQRQENIVKDSVRFIAKEIYVAPSTIVHFCQQLGFSGFNDFKKQYLEELNYLSSHFQHIDPNYPFERNDKNTVIAQKIEVLYEETLKDCMSLIEHDSLQKCVNILLQAQYIYICSSGAQRSLSDTFKDKMLKIGKHVFIFTSEDDLYYTSCYCDIKNSCFLFVSYSGETSSCIRIAQNVKARHIPCFCITSYGNNTLSHMVQDCLYVSTREKMTKNLGSFSFNLCVMYLFDVLYANVFNMHYEKNLENKIKYSRIYEKREQLSGRISHNPILKDDE